LYALCAYVGNIIRSAVAFGATSVIVVGDRKISTFGNFKTKLFIRFEHYSDVTTAVSSLKTRGFRILGVEIGKDAKSITSEPFEGPTVFMLGNEGQGLNQKQIDLCDDLVYIPQYGKGTASLNVSNAAAIVLHRYAVWAQFEEQTIEGEKFLVEPEAQVTGKRPREGEEYQLSEYELEVRAQRQARRAAAEQEDGEPATEDAEGVASEADK
jgi:tRNA(Leu) C34 or U34 (ribose-2'-O)-methylase TrmL